MGEYKSKLSDISGNFRVRDIQKERYLSLFNVKIPKALEDAAFENENFKITYKLLSEGKLGIYEKGKTSSQKLTVQAKVVSKRSSDLGAEIVVPIDIVELPQYTDDGFIVNGTRYEILGKYEPATGWYLNNKGEMSLNVASGMPFQIIVNSGIIKIALKGKKMNMAVFMKALTGLSYLDLAKMIGLNLECVANTFLSSPVEKSVQECVSEVANFIFKNKVTVDIYNFANVQSDIRKMFKPPYISFGAEYKLRTEYFFSFKNRASGRVLAETITLSDGRVIEKGSILNQMDLEVIDQERTELKIKQGDKIFNLVKYDLGDEFNVNHILNALNILATREEGLELVESNYQIENRIVAPLDTLFMKLIEENLSKITKELYSIESSSVATGVLKKVASLNLRNISTILSSYKEVQGSESNNVLSYLSKGSKITTGYSAKGAVSNDLLNIQHNQLGVLDEFDSPESKQVGLVHASTLLSVTDEVGFLRTPFLNVVDGVETDDVLYLTPFEQRNKFILDWSVKLDEIPEDGQVQAFYNGRFVNINKSLVNLKRVSSLQDSSLAHAMIPFAGHNAGKRLTMGSNHGKQSVPVILNQRPRVATGVESLIDYGIFRAEDILREAWTASYELQKYLYEYELEQTPITLVNATTENTSRTFKFQIMNSEIPEHLRYCFKTVANYRQNSSQAINHYRVNVNDNNTWCGKDIVIYHISMDIKQADTIGMKDFGALKFSDEVFNEKSLALGTNLKVMYKTYEGSTMDDAFVFRQGLVTDDTLTSINIKEITVELKEGDDFKEYFNGDKIPNLNPNGTPIVGNFYHPGDVLIGKFSKVMKDSETEIIKDKSKRLDDTEEGQVIDVYKSDNVITVTLAHKSTVMEGDKFAGRYGNKGVCAKIVPDTDMPFIEDTGEIPDMILNPLGVPSRMNIGQLIEVLLGLACEKMGKFAVVAPHLDGDLDYVRDLAKVANVGPKYIIDGRTGIRSTRPVSYGVMYILKMEHLVEKKLNAINFSKKINPITLQARKGKKQQGGQAFSEMEAWCLESAGAYKVLQDIYSIQSDDLVAKRKLKKLIEANPYDIELKGTNRCDYPAQTVVRLNGVEIIPEDNEYMLKPLKDSIIRGFASRPLNIRDANCIYDASIFGNMDSPDKLGLRENWGYVELGCEIIHPFWVDYGGISKLIVVRNDGKEELMKANTLKKIIDSEKFVRFDEYYPTMCNKLHPSAESGMYAAVKILKNYSWDTTVKYLEGRINGSKQKGKTYYSNIKLLESVKMFKENGIEPKDFINTLFPIMPLCFREDSKIQANIKNDFNSHYTKIIRKIKSIQQFSGSENTSKNTTVQELYNLIKYFLGYAEPENSLNKQKKKQTVATFFLGREKNNEHSFFREHMLKKRLDFSGRTVISPSRDVRLTPLHVGLPIVMAVQTYKPFLQSILRHKYGDMITSPKDVDVMLNAIVHEDIKSLQSTFGLPIDMAQSMYKAIFENVKEFVEDQVILLGRQPSLHKYSIRAFRPVLTRKLTIEVNTLVCGGFNADFDGDQMWYAAVITKSAKEEAMQKLSVLSSLVNPKDSSIVLEHSQDMVLGVYFATMLHDNKLRISEDDRYKNIVAFDSVGQLKSEVDMGFMSVHDLAVLTYGEHKYLSTAGRILFNSLLPDGWGFTDEPFTNPLGIEGIKPQLYRNLRYDGLIRNGKFACDMEFNSLKGINRDIVENFGNETVVETFQKILEFGLFHADRSCVSIGLDDIQEHSKTQWFIDRANKLVEKVEKDFDKGLLSEEDRKSVTISIYSKAKDNLKKILLDELPRNNNLFIMADSGARGSLDQLMQTMGIIGNVAKMGGEAIETPVLSSYGRGLNSFQNHIGSFGARGAIADVQNGTSISGYNTRITSYICSGLKIVEEDCGNNQEVIIKYAEPDNDYLNNITLDILDNTLSANYEDLYLVQNMINEQRVLTSDAFEVLIKNRVEYIEFEDDIISKVNGENLGKRIRIQYKLDPAWKSLLLYRVTDDERLPYLIGGKFISSRTVKYIEEKNIRKARIRLMLNCKSIDGVCSKCYGKKYDTPYMPKVGEYIGFETAQALGESSAQLQMNSSHGGGAAKSDQQGNGIDFYNSLLSGKINANFKHAVISGTAGYVSLKSSGVNTLVVVKGEFGKESIYSVTGGVSVKEGEYVDAYDALTPGFVSTAEIGECETLTSEQLRKRQYNLIDLYYFTYKGAGLEINTRHFEVLARLQTSYVEILDGLNTPFKSRGLYSISEVNAYEKEHGIVLDKSFKVLNQSAIIGKTSGGFSLLAFENFNSNLGKIFFNDLVVECKSPISRMFIGEDVYSPKTRKLARRDEVEYVETVEEVEVDTDDFGYLENTLDDNIQINSDELKSFYSELGLGDISNDNEGSDVGLSSSFLDLNFSNDETTPDVAVSLELDDIEAVDTLPNESVIEDSDDFVGVEDLDISLDDVTEEDKPSSLDRSSSFLDI